MIAASLFGLSLLASLKAGHRLKGDCSLKKRKSMRLPNEGKTVYLQLLLLVGAWLLIELLDRLVMMSKSSKSLIGDVAAPTGESLV